MTTTEFKKTKTILTTSSKQLMVQFNAGSQNLYILNSIIKASEYLDLDCGTGKDIKRFLTQIREVSLEEGNIGDENENVNLEKI
jgi:hypothetical protein